MILVQNLSRKVVALSHNLARNVTQRARTTYTQHAPIWRAKTTRAAGVAMDTTTQMLRAVPKKIPVRHRIAAAAVAIPCFGVLTAFGIAPDTMIEKVQVTDVIQNLSLPALTPLAEADDATYVREERIQRGDTVASLLGRLQINDPLAEQALRTHRDARALYQLVPGRTVRASTTGDGRLVSLRYLNDSQLLSVERKGNGFDIEQAPAQLELRTEMKSGDIRSSLFGATDAANVPDAIAVQMAEIFSGDIDFRSDLRRGDHFSVIYEAYYQNGEPVRTGRVLAAEFINQGRVYQAAYYEAIPGRGGYYAFDGKSLRRQFLRSPLEFTRITSGFTPARFHPVLKKWRAHHGIDFGAPIGTRVHATADGVVEFVGQQGGYGNLVILRHTGGVTTYYGHLSRFANIHKGMRVSQNDVIAYVGMTGLATGPHLHYEYRINNVYQNPLRVAMPAAPSIKPEQREPFDAAVAALKQPLAALRTLNLASAD